MTYIYLFLFCFLCSAANGGGDEFPENEESEYLVEDPIVALQDSLDIHMGLLQAIADADTLLAVAQIEGDESAMNYAYKGKVVALFNASQYAMAIECSEFIETHADSLHFPETDLFTVSFIKTLSYIEMGKYRTAIRIAKELYENANNIDLERVSEVEVIRAKSNALLCIGLANNEMGLPDDAVDNINRSVDLIREARLEKELSLNIEDALTYRMQCLVASLSPEEALKAVERYDKELDEFQQEETGVFQGDYYLQMYLAYVDVYVRLGRYQPARDYLQFADEVISENDISNALLGEVYTVKASYYRFTGDSQVAIAYADSAINLFRNIKKPTLVMKSLSLKMLALHNASRHSEVYDVANKLIQLKDSFNTEVFNSSVDEMQTILNVDRLESDKAKLKSRLLTGGLVVVVLVLATIVGFVVMKRRQDAKEKKMLSEQREQLRIQVAEQTKELRQQKETIEEANKSITDSITYAKRIQNSILPDFSLFVDGNLSVTSAFAFYLPCHIVSGDFYWAMRREHYTLIACVDCTGHGVPGAFMSMIGTTILGDVCRQEQLPEPSEILEQLHDNLARVLKQNGEDGAWDGMDIAIMCFDSQAMTVKLSSASRTSYICTEEGVQVDKGVKRGIGDRTLSREIRPFETTTYNVKRGDVVYMTTDGYPDQFGGPRTKRLMAKGIQSIVEEARLLPFEEQKDFIEHKYWEWRGECEQLDDITFVGVLI
ncbi:MAG: SpoIIE family protein phosphatase [Marinilabiliaceae bacterium]|nr:SpoIIE family protein phosphatase [Marinilabiliaceae bacterium]